MSCPEHWLELGARLRASACNTLFRGHSVASIVLEEPGCQSEVPGRTLRASSFQRRLGVIGTGGIRRPGAHAVVTWRLAIASNLALSAKGARSMNVSNQGLNNSRRQPIGRTRGLQSGSTTTSLGVGHATRVWGRLYNEDGIIRGTDVGECSYTIELQHVGPENIGASFMRVSKIGSGLRGWIFRVSRRMIG